jgi:hypothetical protein
MPVKFVEAITESPKLNDPKTAGSLMDCTIIFSRQWHKEWPDVLLG